MKRPLTGNYFIFATGIENSYPTIQGGRLRVDEMDKCGHYARWREDFDCVQHLGIHHLRYGPPLHRAWLGPERYDWSFADETYAELCRRDIIPITDLCHFGVPDWLGNFQNPDFPALFARYAGAFARRFPWVQLYTPVNEMYICALFSARYGWWNEQLTDDRAFVTALKHVVRANQLAMCAILDARPDAIFIQSESTEYFHAMNPRAIGPAEFMNEVRFLSLDLNYGRRVGSEMYEYLLDNGLTRNEYHAFLEGQLRHHCVMGNDYYVTNEHLVAPDGSTSASGEVFGYHVITRQYYDRYRLPVMHTETNLRQGGRGDEAVMWLRKQWANVLRVRNDGVPIVGFTWYSLTDQVDWDTALREPNGHVDPLGLYDLDRRIRPVGEAYRELIREWRAVLPTQSVVLRLPVDPPSCSGLASATAGEPAVDASAAAGADDESTQPHRPGRLPAPDPQQPAAPPAPSDAPPRPCDRLAPAQPMPRECTRRRTAACAPAQTTRRRQRAMTDFRQFPRYRALAAAGALLAAALAGCGDSSDGGGSPTLISASACAQPTTPTGGSSGTPTTGPEISTGYQSKDIVHSRTIMAVTANPLATKAACDVLNQGGTAVDAAVAAQTVLTLTEPQSSGIGGGAFMLHYDAATRTVRAFDGREIAPAAATENYLRWISSTDQTTPRPNARASGRSIGTPGVLRMLELAHRGHGRLPWSDLFQPAIALSRDGFAISPRMAGSIADVRASLARDPEAAAYFLNPDGSAKAAGTLLRNPALADTLAAIAAGGANAFYTGAIAQDIVAEIADTTGGITPGLTTLADLASYQAKERTPVCTTYRVYVVCGMPPPSSGGITVAATLGILENFDMAQHAPTGVDRDGGRPTVTGVHLFSEANRLAYADRDKYIADTDFVPLPGGTWDTMLDKNYLRQRASLISLTRSIGVAQPGDLGPVPLAVADTPERGTTHYTLVDAYGNVVAMTTTVESAFGSFHMTRGFLLNNQLTDFSAAPTDAAGTPIANRVQPGKRPRSSMAPTLVFRAAPDGSRGEFLMATGSPGGSTIIQYVGKTLVGALDWGLNAQQAVSMVNFGAANSITTNVGGEHPNINAADNGAADPLVQGLRALGHTVSVAPQASGLSSIARTVVNGQAVLAGGADPRRENLTMGDVVTP